MGYFLRYGLFLYLVVFGLWYLLKFFLESFLLYLVLLDLYVGVCGVDMFMCMYLCMGICVYMCV